MPGLGISIIEVLSIIIIYTLVIMDVCMCIYRIMESRS